MQRPVPHPAPFKEQEIFNRQREAIWKDYWVKINGRWEYKNPHK